MSKRVAKIIPCFFGPRRNRINLPKNTKVFLEKRVIENEINIQNGIDTDIIICENLLGGIYNRFLDKYNKTKTNNGKIIVERRLNKAGQFGAHYSMFHKYMNEYNYFFFCEDDVVIYKNNYMKRFVDFLDVSNDIGYAALLPIQGSPYPTHSGGGIGLTSKEKFLKACDIEKVLKTINESKILNPMLSSFFLLYQSLQDFEIRFTNKFVKAGMNIMNHPCFSPLPRNWKDLGNERYFRKYATKINVRLEKIFFNGDEE